MRSHTARLEQPKYAIAQMWAVTREHLTLLYYHGVPHIIGHIIILLSRFFLLLFVAVKPFIPPPLLPINRATYKQAVYKR